MLRDHDDHDWLVITGPMQAGCESSSWRLWKGQATLQNKRDSAKCSLSMCVTPCFAVQPAHVRPACFLYADQWSNLSLQIIKQLEKILPQLLLDFT